MSSLKRARTSVSMPFAPRRRTGVSRAEASRIAKRQSIRTSTKKSFQKNLALAVDNTGTSVPLSDVALGADDHDRVGNGLLPVSLTLRYSFRVNSTLGVLGTRILIVRAHTLRAGVGPTAAEILDLSPNGTAITVGTQHTAAIIHSRLATFDILYDAVETVNNNNPAGTNQSGRAIVKTFKLETFPQVYTDAGITANNKFYLIAITNDAASSTLQFTADLQFIDK